MSSISLIAKYKFIVPATPSEHAQLVIFCSDIFVVKISEWRH